MELHETLYELGLTSGRAVFDDADLLRAALDDYLDEGAASTGDINLLVDAVRLGAFRMMLTTIDSGAEPGRAVESAGDMLARDRGTSDVTATRWACALLGFAVGKVSATDVRRFDRHATQVRPPVPPPATTLPPPPPLQSPSGPPPSAPPYVGGYPAASYPPATPAKKKPWVLIGVVGAVLLIALVGGLVAALVSGNGDDTPAATDDPTTSAPTSPTSPSTPSSSTEAADPTTPPAGQISGTGYSFVLPDGWKDVTKAVTGSGQGGLTDLAVAWGNTFDTARANLIIETAFAGGETDPDAIKDTWQQNMVGATGATPVDNGPTTIDGEQAVTVKISRTNENGIEIEQFGFLTIHDGDLYSLILSTQAGDEKAQDSNQDILDSWSWQ